LEKLEEIDYAGGVRVEVAVSAQMTKLDTGEIVWSKAVSAGSPLVDGLCTLHVLLVQLAQITPPNVLIGFDWIRVLVSLKPEAEPVHGALLGQITILWFN